MKSLVLHDRLSADEEALGVQIVKDLHRTGVADYCGVREALFHMKIA